MPRNRHIYQSDAIFISDGTIPPTGTHAAAKIKQLTRVQSANYGGTLNRVDINQFGQLARIDSLVVESPDVSFDTEYYIHDGYNEAKMGFTLNTGFAISALSGLLVTATGSNSGAAGVVSGRNIFVFSTPDGTDANLTGSYGSGSGNSIVSIGNAFLTDYSVNAAVGSIPTATVSYEAFNGRSNISQYLSGQLAAVDISGNETTAKFTLPEPTTGTGVSVTALRPGDIILTLGDAGTWVNTDGSAGSAHIQSFSISVPMGRSTLQRLGSNFGYAKEIDFPVNIDISISALANDLKSGSLVEELNQNTLHTFTLLMKDSAGSGRMAYQVKGAQLVSENFSSSIGSNKTVDLNFTAQVGGPSDTGVGLFMSGATTALPFS